MSYLLIRSNARNLVRAHFDCKWWQLVKIYDCHQVGSMLFWMAYIRHWPVLKVIVCRAHFDWKYHLVLMMTDISEHVLQSTGAVNTMQRFSLCSHSHGPSAWSCSCYPCLHYTIDITHLCKGWVIIISENCYVRYYIIHSLMMINTVASIPMCHGHWKSLILSIKICKMSGRISGNSTLIFDPVRATPLIDGFPCERRSGF